MHIKNSVLAQNNHSYSFQSRSITLFKEEDSIPSTPPGQNIKNAEMSKFYTPVDLSHTALLIADVQEDILQRFPSDVSSKYLSTILPAIKLFRKEIARRRSQADKNPSSGFDGVPLIVHHVFPFGINSNSFVYPYNRLSTWVKKLQDSRYFSSAFTDPNHPHYTIPEILKPEGGWGGKDEIIISKIQAGCSSSSDVLPYFRARGIRHVVLCGLTTCGSILGSARLGAELDFHIIVPKEGVMDDDEEVNKILLEKVLPRVVDVVDMKDVEELLK
jgi:nicotinamidase-related amidase